MLWLRQESGHIERHDAVCAMLMIHRTDKLSDLLIFLLLLLLLAVESPDHSLPFLLFLPRLLVRFGALLLGLLVAAGLEEAAAFF